MPRKKLSPSNPSTEDKGDSEEIESDSSLELNSRRNVYRKKPQRKCFLKQSHNDSHESTENGQREKLQGNSSEKNEKRPPIIKIFRRIDRKAKNIYLVDDKVEDSNELETPPVSKNDFYNSNGGESPLSQESTSDKRSLFNRCTVQTPLRTFSEHCTKYVKTNCGVHDFDKVNVRNQPGDGNASCHFMINNVKIAKKSEIDVCNQTCGTDNLYSLVTDIADTPGRDNIWNQPCSTYDLYSPVTGIVQTHGGKDVRNQPCNADDFYSVVTDIAQKHCKADVWNQFRDTETLYSSETDIDQTPRRPDICSQSLSSDSDTPNSSEVDIEQTHGRDVVCSQNLSSDFDAANSSDVDIDRTLGRPDICSQSLSSDSDTPNSSEVDIEQTHGRDVVCSQNMSSDSDVSNSSEVDIEETHGRDVVCSQNLSSASDASNSSDTDIDQGPIKPDVYSQILSSDFDDPRSSVTIEQSSGKYKNFGILYSDLYISSDGESDYSNFLLNSYHDSSNLTARNIDHTLNKAEVY